MEMEQGQLSALLLVVGAAHQGGDFRQRKDLLHQGAESTLAHAAYLVVGALLQVPVLLQLAGVLGVLFLQFLA